MKTKLDAALLAVPPLAIKAKPDTFETLWDSNGCFSSRFTNSKTRMDSVISKSDWSTSDKIVNCAGSWDTAPYLLGAIHRMQEDGHTPLVKLGLSAAQEQAFLVLCRDIRGKLANKAIVSGQSEQRTTLTKQIHDSIIANHF